jgi:hypothetical protein
MDKAKSAVSDVMHSGGYSSGGIASGGKLRKHIK